jgi:hypothetical protein
MELNGTSSVKITLSSEVSSYGSYWLELTGSYKMALAISSEVSQHGSANGGTC